MLVGTVTPVLMLFHFKPPSNLISHFIIYGESVAEVSGKATYFDKPNYSIDYWLKYSSKVKPDGMLDKNISKKDINIFQWPSIKDLKKTKTKKNPLGRLHFLGCRKTNRVY